MYIDGFVLLAIYIMSAASLLLGIYNHFEIKELISKLKRPTKRITPPPPITVKRPKGHWD